MFIVHLRGKGFAINRGLNRVRKKLIKDNGKEGLRFSDFILGKGDEQFGVLGFVPGRVFVYCGSGILYEASLDGLGLGSGAMWIEAFNKELESKQHEGHINREAIIEWVKQNTHPSAFAYYYDMWRWEHS